MATSTQPSPSDQRRRARRRAFWALAAERLPGCPDAMERASAILRRQEEVQSGGLRCPYHAKWHALIEMGQVAVVSALLDASDEGDTLRSASPFGWLVSPRERAALWTRP